MNNNWVNSWWAESYIFWIITTSNEAQDFRPTERDAFKSIAEQAKLAAKIREGRLDFDYIENKSTY